MNNQVFHAALSGDLSWRAFAVFAVCSAAYHADQPFTIPEIATALQLSERQTRRIVSDLCKRGFLARGSSKRKVFVLPAPAGAEPAALAPTDRGDRVWVEAPAVWCEALSKLGKPNASRAKIKAGIAPLLRAFLERTDPAALQHQTLLQIASKAAPLAYLSAMLGSSGDLDPNYYKPVSTGAESNETIPDPIQPNPIALSKIAAFFEGSHY